MKIREKNHLKKAMNAKKRAAQIQQKINLNRKKDCKERKKLYNSSWVAYKARLGWPKNNNIFIIFIQSR